MKVRPFSYYSLVVTAENDAERLWLKQAIGGIEKEDIKILDNYISVSLEDSCRMEDRTPAKDIMLSEAMSKDGITDGAWGFVDEIEISFTPNS